MSEQKTLHSYLVGFFASILLTILAFAVIQTRLMTDAHQYLTLAILAITQLVVQSVCFLRLNTSKEGRWNLMPFLFTILIITFLAGGSMWIMYNLNYDMTFHI